MKKIYDAFLFFNELDLLEIRLTMLDPYVDYFVISECDFTFSGNKKPFHFDENKERFSKFLPKIIHIKNENSDDTTLLPNNYTGNQKIVFDEIIKKYRVIQNSPQTDGGKPHWCRDYLHREYVNLGLADCNDDDIVIFSDLDEMPNPEILKNLDSYDMNKAYCMYQDNNNFFVNNIASTNWKGSIFSKYLNIKNRSLNEMRVTSRQSNCTTIEFIPNGGWHLSFMGGVEIIKEKIMGYGHQEFNNPHILNNIQNNINNNKDLFFRNPPSQSNKNFINNNKGEEFYFNNMKVVDINGYLPENIVELLNNKFTHLIKKI